MRPGEAGLTSGTWYSAYIHGILDRRRLSARFLSAGAGAARLPGDGARTHGQDLSPRSVITHSSRARSATCASRTPAGCASRSRSRTPTTSGCRTWASRRSTGCSTPRRRRVRARVPAPGSELAAALARPGSLRTDGVRHAGAATSTSSRSRSRSSGTTPTSSAILRLAGLPLYAAERSARHPLVVIGGAVTFVNPEPLAPFADVIAAGEGEVLVPALVRADRRRADRDGPARGARP